MALSSGYSQSKWVAEQILYAAAAKTALDPVVVRVGQVSGGPCGAWAANEWYPIMVQSAIQLGCYPEDPRVRFTHLLRSVTALTSVRRLPNSP